MSLKIEQITITDNLVERAKTCTVTLVPSERVGAPAGEFQYAGDTQSLSGTVLRPNGAVINVMAGYGSVPLHCVFSGTIEYMDDLEDADLYEYRIVLSNAPVSQSYRAKLTILFNGAQNKTLGSPITSTHAILQRACAMVGIPFGRCDLPSVLVYGTYEIIRKNICEVAEDLCQPFNQFASTQYSVRVSERDGLSIVAINYTKGGVVSNLYELNGVEQKTRSFERYMPDNRIGSSDVLLIGADIYSDDWNLPNTTTEWHTATKIYHSDSRDHDDLGTDSWTETDTTVEFVFEITDNPGEHYTGWTDFDSCIQALIDGQIADLNLVESNTIYTVTNSYDNDGATQQQKNAAKKLQEAETAENSDTEEGQAAIEAAKGEVDAAGSGGVTQHTQKVETWYTYEAKEFPMHIYKTGERLSNVLVYEETLTTLYPDGSDYDQTLVKRGYGYAESGVQNSTTTKTYYNNGRNGWTLQNTKVEQSDSPSLTNAAIQFYVDNANKGPDSAYDYASKQASKSAVVIGKYKLLNGARVAVNTPPPRTITNPSWIGYDPSASSFEQEQKEKRCFQMSIPYMGYGGLRLLWAMSLKQKQLETHGSYWELVKITTPIDTGPSAGESLLVSGSSGVCDSVEHVITSDSALTTVSIRRLV